MLSFVILNSAAQATATEIKISAFRYPVYVNGKEIKLNEALIKDGRTYVQLRELCAWVNIAVDWRDPAYHMLPIPGGSFPEGINLTNPTYVYTNEVTDYYDTSQRIICVEITGIYSKYKADCDLKYGFGDKGLVIKEADSEKIIPLKYNPSNERIYVSVDEFREKIQPYLVDICMQSSKQTSGAGNSEQ